MDSCLCLTALIRIEHEACHLRRNGTKKGIISTAPPPPIHRKRSYFREFSIDQPHILTTRRAAPQTGKTKTGVSFQQTAGEKCGGACDRCHDRGRNICSAARNDRETLPEKRHYGRSFPWRELRKKMNHPWRGIDSQRHSHYFERFSEHVTPSGPFPAAMHPQHDAGAGNSRPNRRI